MSEDDIECRRIMNNLEREQTKKYISALTKEVEDLRAENFKLVKENNRLFNVEPSFPIKHGPPMYACWADDEYQKQKSLSHKLAGALERTLISLVSYKKYIPAPCKQIPIDIIGSAEAEQEAIDILKEWKASK